MLYTTSMSQELRQRADQIWIQISSIQNPQSRIDLGRMYKNVEALLTEISREEVECRRLHRETNRLEELRAKTDERLLQIEQYITLAHLYG